MNSLTQLSSSIAWFRLHESAIKNEQERTLLNYKLLMHSCRSYGFRKQILGDLYLSFDQKELAQEQYFDSYRLYMEISDFFHAAKILILMKKYGFEISSKRPSLLSELKKEKKKYILFIEELESN